LLHPYGENKKSITLNFKAGVIRYKFHRGGWATVEKQDWGAEVPDRIITIHKDTTLTDSVARWLDQMFIDRWYALAKENEDTNRVKTLASIAYAYANYDYFNADSALYYAQTALQLLQKIMISVDSRLKTQTGYINQMMSLQATVASLMHTLGNYPKSLELRFENLKLAEKQNDTLLLIYRIMEITGDYISMKDYMHLLSYGKLADSILSKWNPNDTIATFSKTFVDWHVKRVLATAYYNLQMQDSALNNAKKLITFL